MSGSRLPLRRPWIETGNIAMFRSLLVELARWRPQKFNVRNTILLPRNFRSASMIKHRRGWGLRKPSRYEFVLQSSGLAQTEC